jgi:hypothetical protein
MSGPLKFVENTLFTLLSIEEIYAPSRTGRGNLTLEMKLGWKGALSSTPHSPELL